MDGENEHRGHWIVVPRRPRPTLRRPVDTIALTYLSNDTLTEGVGASQVLAYVERLVTRGVDVTLHTFEKETPTTVLVDRLRQSGVRWMPHPFGRHGVVGGATRLLSAARFLRGADLVHARADLSGRLRAARASRGMGLGLPEPVSGSTTGARLAARRLPRGARPSSDRAGVPLDAPTPS